MKKEIVFSIVLVVFLLCLLLIFEMNPQITSAAVAGQRKCVGARAALKFINEKGCYRVYESEKCEKQGLVEIQC